MRNIDKTNALAFNHENGFGVSKRYVPINTNTVLETFQDAGYTIRKVQAAGVVDPEKQGYQKHLVRMSHPDTQLKIDGLTPEIVLKNSFDGSSAFRLNIGVYRLICSNGLEVGKTFSTERVVHLGTPEVVLNRVLTAADRIKSGLPQLIDEIGAMRGYRLNLNEALHLAHTMGLILKPNASSVEYRDLLKVNRPGDVPRDAFTIMNVIQENALQGNFRYLTFKGENRDIPKISKSRPIKSIDRTQFVNQSIWDKTLDLINY